MNTQPALSTRRSFLRGAGITLTLPWLDLPRRNQEHPDYIDRRMGTKE
jgi:hypothetical protein